MGRLCRVVVDDGGMPSGGSFRATCRLNRLRPSCLHPPHSQRANAAKMAALAPLFGGSPWAAACGSHVYARKMRLPCSPPSFPLPARAARSALPARAARPRCPPALPARAARPRCPPALPARAARPRCPPALPARAARPRCPPALPARAARPRCPPALPARAARPRCPPALPARAARPRCPPALPARAARPRCPLCAARSALPLCAASEARSPAAASRFLRGAPSRQGAALFAPENNVPPENSRARARPSRAERSQTRTCVQGYLDSTFRSRARARARGAMLRAIEWLARKEPHPSRPPRSHAGGMQQPHAR